MSLTTVRIGTTITAGRIEGEDIVILEAADVGEVLQAGGAAETGRSIPRSTAEFAPLITRPDKIVCVGVNYRDHIAEMGGVQPGSPTYFAKFRAALIGAHDDITLPDPALSTQIDWEAELAIVIATPCRHASAAEAMAAIAGFTVLNDVSVRDYQRRTSQFLAGKTFEGMTPLGPSLVSTAEVGDGSGLAITTEIDGVVKQSSSTSELCFNAVDIVADLSHIISLEPGDVIATGTPGGVGAARTPPEWMGPGTTVRCSIERIGTTENTCRLANRG